MSEAIDNLGDKANSNGFDKNPKNINKKGRSISLRKKMREILEGDGELFIPIKQVIRFDDTLGVTVRVPDETQLVLKLKQWAFSNKGSDSLKAIQMIIEHIDGKPSQSLEIDHGLDGIITVFKIPDDGRN